jgi:nitrite reductase (NO-forming)
MVRRDLDRRITIGGLGVALTFVAASIVVAASGGPTWTALHLLLAGGAGTAIGAAMPFFAAALTAAPPARPALRVAVVLALAGAALTIAIAVPAVHRAGSLVGAGLYLIGLAGLLAATLLPVRGALGPRRWVVLGGYAVGVAFVVAGVLLVTGLLHDFAPVESRWAVLKPAHAWLNLVGFVGIVIATTFIHLVPTVLGARIVEGWLPILAIGGLALGVSLVASGFAFGSDAIARVGALMSTVGAVAVPADVVAAARQPGRGRWTTDPGWHAFTTWTLAAAAAWLAAGVVLAAGLVLVHGATPAGWSLVIVGVPLALGCVLQALIGAATHLLPTVGPASGPRRASARRRLGIVAVPRVVALQVGILLLAVGGPLRVEAASIAGAVLTTVIAAGTLAMLAWGAIAPPPRSAIG